MEMSVVMLPHLEDLGKETSFLTTFFLIISEALSNMIKQAHDKPLLQKS